MDRVLLLCDVDGVIVDFVGGVLDVLVERCGLHFTPSQVMLWSIRDALNLTAAQWRVVTDAISEPGFARRLKPTPAAEELQRLMAGGTVEVQFVTSPWASSPTWCFDRTAWLVHHYGKASGQRVTFTREKHMVAGDLFVDDNADSVEAWTRAQVARRYPEPWQGFLWDAPYNRGAEVGLRVQSFDDVMRAFRPALRGAR